MSRILTGKTILGGDSPVQVNGYVRFEFNIDTAN